MNELPPSDRPDDDLLKDDERLDAWYENYVRETRRKAGGKVRRGDNTDFNHLPQFNDDSPYIGPYGP